jgi:DNA polymerase elongation subunit (family B)
MRILMLDIERSPNIAYVWGLFKENIPLARIIDTSNLLCYAAKWYGEDKIYYDSIYKTSTKKLLVGLHKLIDTADAVVHYNGTEFDMPVINTAFVQYGITPPAPYKNIDLLQVVRKQFKFTSNKMDFVSDYLGTGRKKETTFDLWIGCMNNDQKSWEIMEDYNIEDVLILERLYVKLLPWIKGHPNHGLYSTDGLICPTCGSKNFQKRGFAFTTTGRYQKYCCTDCGSWFRDKKVYARGEETFRHA